MYYGDTGQFRRLTSIDGGATWTTDSWLLEPPLTGFFGGSGEPAVYVPPGKEGAEMIVFYDLVEYASYSGTEKRVNYSAITTDKGATWHHKKVAGCSGAGFKAPGVRPVPPRGRRRFPHVPLSGTERWRRR